MGIMDLTKHAESSFEAIRLHREPCIDELQRFRASLQFVLNAHTSHGPVDRHPIAGALSEDAR